MAADPSVLGRHTEALPLDYQNINKRIQSCVNILLNVECDRSTYDFE